jgi:hypothetical protein
MSSTSEEVFEKLEAPDVSLGGFVFDFESFEVVEECGGPGRLLVAGSVVTLTTDDAR